MNRINPNSKQSKITKIHEKHGILLDRGRYTPISEEEVEYKTRRKHKKKYKLKIEDLKNMSQSDRVKVGNEVRKFYKILKLEKKYWNEKKVDELIQDIIDWSESNPNRVGLIEYFRLNFIMPEILTFLKEKYPKFNDFFINHSEFVESQVINGCMNGEFNGNFGLAYLKSRYSTKWTTTEDTQSQQVTPVNIILPNQNFTIIPPSLLPPAGEPCGETNKV